MRATRLAQILLASFVVANGAMAAESGMQQPSQVEEGAAELVRGDVAKAIASYTDALRDTGLANDRRATILNDRAVANARLGQTKLALEDYNHAVELFPEYPVAYNNRGNLLLTIGQFGEAIKQEHGEQDDASHWRRQTSGIAATLGAGARRGLWTGAGWHERGRAAQHRPASRA